MPTSKTIFDIGVSEGNDSDFYMKKGFQVVAVEADPSMYRNLLARFNTEIQSGQLTLLNQAAALQAGEIITFYQNLDSQGMSSIRPPTGAARALAHSVATTSWAELSSRYGIPYYLKIDIEGGEEPFLMGMVGASQLPQYISSEIQNFRPIELFNEMGYTHFRMINQLKVAQFSIPNPALEGNLITDIPHHHWSPFLVRNCQAQSGFHSMRYARFTIVCMSCGRMRP